MPYDFIGNKLHPRLTLKSFVFPMISYSMSPKGLPKSFLKTTYKCKPWCYLNLPVHTLILFVYTYWYIPWYYFSSSQAPLHQNEGRLPSKSSTYQTGKDDLMYKLLFFSTFEELKLPVKGPWRVLEWFSSMNHPQHPVSTSIWIQPRTWWAESPLFHCFCLVTKPQQSTKCFTRAEIQASSYSGLKEIQQCLSDKPVAIWAWQPCLGCLTDRQTASGISRKFEPGI